MCKGASAPPAWLAPNPSASDEASFPERSDRAAGAQIIFLMSRRDNSRRRSASVPQGGHFLRPSCHLLAARSAEQQIMRVKDCSMAVTCFQLMVCRRLLPSPVMRVSFAAFVYVGGRVVAQGQLE
jgi:hypothetical protein